MFRPYSPEVWRKADALIMYVEDLDAPWRNMMELQTQLNSLSLNLQVWHVETFPELKMICSLFGPEAVVIARIS